MPRGVKKVLEDKKVEVKEIKELKKDSGLCEFCRHTTEFHYGTEKRWCNKRSCKCQAYIQ